METKLTSEDLSRWLDDELAPEEREAFEQSLTDADRQRLEQERALEDAIAARIGEPLPCPDTTWARVKADLQQARTPRAATPAIQRWGFFAAAAALIVVGAAILTQGDVAYVFTPIDTVAALAAMSETANDHDSVQAFLREHKMDVQLARYQDANPNSDHHVELLGARAMDRDGGVEVLYDCCGFPTRLVVVREGTAGAQKLQAAATAGEVQGMRVVNGYMLAVVGMHDAREFLSVVEPGSLA